MCTIHHENSLLTDVLPSWFFLRTCTGGTGSETLREGAMACWQNSYLGNRKLEVLLRDVLSALAQCVHTGFRADTAHLGTRALTHLLGK